MSTCKCCSIAAKGPRFQWSQIYSAMVLVAQSDSLRPMGYSPPGSFLHGILQARILEWVAISSSKERCEAGEKIAGRSRAGENRG